MQITSCQFAKSENEFFKRNFAVSADYQEIFKFYVSNEKYSIYTEIIHTHHIGYLPDRQIVKIF
jgi:hypothetical protein